MQILIVEDEVLAAEKLKGMVAAINDEAEIVGCTRSIKSTVQWLQNNPEPELILMDIELSDGHSFEIFNQVAIGSTIIFTTAYDEFAIRAFQVNSIDYLMKPVQKEDLARAFGKYRRLQQTAPRTSLPKIDVQQLMQGLQAQLQPREYRSRFLVRLGQKFVPVEVSEIAYFFVEGRAIFFKTFDNRKFIVDYTLDALEEMLVPNAFFRINRSFIVSAKSIAQLHYYINGRIMLTLKPSVEEQIIVSRDNVATFKKWIGQ